jgi:hypothetical protein
MVEQTTDQQMEEVLNVTGDDPLSDAATTQLGVFREEPKEDLRKIAKETDMLLDVGGGGEFLIPPVPDKKIDQKDIVGLLFPLTPNDPIFDDIKKMFEEEAYAPAIATSALAALSIIPGFGRLPKSAAKKIARETAESLKKSESKVAPDMEQLEKLYDASVKNKELSKTPKQRKEPTLNIPPAPPKRNRLTEQNTYDLPITPEVDDFIVGEDNYYSKLFDGIIGLESSKLVDKNGNIKVTVFEKWLSENAPAGQAKYTGLQNLVDNAKKEGVEKLSVRDDIANRYMNNEIRLSENILRFNANDTAFDKYGRLEDTVPHNVSDPRFLHFSDHNNRFFVGGGGSNFTSNNITIDPTINQDYSALKQRSQKELFSENTLYPNIEPLVDVRNYEEMIVGLPALPKDTTVSVSPLPRTKTSYHLQRYFPSQYKLARPEAIKTFPTRKDYTHEHYQNELTNLFHIRYTKNADIGDGKPDTFIWHEGQSDISQRRQYALEDADGNPLKDEDGNIITRPVVTQIDKTNPKTGIARSLETRFREAEVADELLQKRRKAMDDLAMIAASRRGEGKTEPYFTPPDYFEQGSDLRDRIKEGLGDVNFSEKSISRVAKNIDSTLAAEKRPTRRIDEAEDNFLDPYGRVKGLPEEIRDINFIYSDPATRKPKRILPEIPFLKGDEADKSKITNLMFQRALKQAIDSGHDKFAWPTSETIRKFSGGSDAPTGVLKTYDVDFINMAKKIYNSTKKPKDPAFEEWWRMEERVRPISFEGTFKIKDDVSRNDLFKIGENIERGIIKKQQKIFEKIQELKVEQRQKNPNDKELIEELKEIQGIYENQFQELTVAGNPILYRINEFKKSIGFGAGMVGRSSSDIEEARQNLIKEINNMYGKPSGIQLKKEFKPHAIPGSKDKKDPTKPIKVKNLMPKIQYNPLVGDLGTNHNIQNYYVMEITPEMKAMLSKGIGFKRGGIVQNKMDSQMSDLFGEEQVA